MIIISRHLKYLFISFLILLSSCAVNPVTGKQELMFVNEDQEMKIGEQAAPSMKWEFGGKYHDPSLESYLATKHSLLQLLVTKPDMSWHDIQRKEFPV
jgi:predicted Zn-dependent protease